MPVEADAPLHPDRIRAVLKLLKQGEDHCGMARELTLEEVATCRAALELVRKGQLAVGLTANTVDAFNKARSVAAQGIDLIETIGRIGKMK